MNLKIVQIVNQSSTFSSQADAQTANTVIKFTLFFKC
jgi:hypothetical protein